MRERESEIGFLRLRLLLVCASWQGRWSAGRMLPLSHSYQRTGSPRMDSPVSIRPPNTQSTPTFPSHDGVSSRLALGGGLKTWLRRLSRWPQMVSFSYRSARATSSFLWCGRTLNWRSGRCFIFVSLRVECQSAYSPLSSQLLTTLFSATATSTTRNVTPSLLAPPSSYSSSPRRRNEKHLGKGRSRDAHSHFRFLTR